MKRKDRRKKKSKRESENKSKRKRGSHRDTEKRGDWRCADWNKRSLCSPPAPLTEIVSVCMRARTEEGDSGTERNPSTRDRLRDWEGDALIIFYPPPPWKRGFMWRGRREEGNSHQDISNLIFLKVKLWHLFPSFHWTHSRMWCMCVFVLKNDGNSGMHEEACPDRKTATQRRSYSRLPLSHSVHVQNTGKLSANPQFGCIIGILHSFTHISNPYPILTSFWIF